MNLKLMPRKNKERELIEVFQNSGLNYKEALIYFTLMKSGQKGCMVRDLIHRLSIERTTIYSILRKLIKYGYIKKGGKSETIKKATIFIAIEPELYFSNLILKKESEINELKNIKQKYFRLFQSIYQNEVEYSYDELDSFIQPYFKPLLEKGWKVRSYYVKKKVPILNYTVYDCSLQSPKVKYIKVSAFHVFIFDYNIEKDENTLKYFINRLKRHFREEILYHTDLKKFLVEEDEIKIFGSIYPSFNLKINIEEIKNSRFFSTYFEDIVDFNNDKHKKSNNFRIEIISVLFPIKNKLFFLFSESRETLKEMVEPILKIEKKFIKNKS